ncbi:hypothetical protein FRX31_009554 [Thalictrum thalictroides]|uniref:Uncharacterized protein n=1 Tax=Thalictrum thalictroides TaxID=46969 RepID=A0A7J6WWB9_THATH|nr:hypothetical protein FRX31_009554 [Thalictrum thalictroides]
MEHNTKRNSRHLFRIKERRLLHLKKLRKSMTSPTTKQPKQTVPKSSTIFKEQGYTKIYTENEGKNSARSKRPKAN